MARLLAALEAKTRGMPDGLGEAARATLAAVAVQFEAAANSPIDATRSVPAGQIIGEQEREDLAVPCDVLSRRITPPRSGAPRIRASGG